MLYHCNIYGWLHTPRLVIQTWFWLQTGEIDTALKISSPSFCLSISKVHQKTKTVLFCIILPLIFWGSFPWGTNIRIKVCFLSLTLILEISKALFLLNILHFSLIPCYNPHIMKHTSPRSQPDSYSQFKEGLGEGLKGVIRQLPYPVAGQIPIHIKRQKNEKKKKRKCSFYTQKQSEKHADSLKLVDNSLITKHG